MMKRMVTSLYLIFYRMFMVLLVVVIAVAMTGSWLGLQKPTILHWIIALWVASLLTIVSLGKFYQKMLSIVVLAVSTVVMIPLMEMAGIFSFYDSYFLWMGGKSGFQEEWILGYELMQMTWITLVCYIIQLILEKNLKFKLGTAVLLFVGLVVSMLLGEKGSLMAMAGIMTFILVTMADYMRSIRSTKKNHDTRAYLLFLTPFIVSYFILMSIVPIREVPYDWKFVKDIYHNLREKTITLWESIVRNEEEFDDVTVGFSDSPWLGDQITKNDRLVMTVVGDRNLLTDVYLRGKTYDRFSNCHWTETIENKADEYPIDILELVYGVKRYDESLQNNYAKRANLKIRYEHFNTAYAFAPGKMHGIANKEYKEAGDVMHFHKEEGYGTEYEVSFFQMNYGVPEFDAFVESVGDLPEDEEIFENGIMVLPLELKGTYTLADLEEYREAMQNQYGQEITLSPTVQQYIDKVTEGCTTQWQRLKAIEKALRSMHYTAEPGAIPKTVKTPEEYLDYFLMESRKGYCAHFATAFVLLARSEGLPARYVEGFRLPFNISRTIRVYSSMAHAWAEVYLEGVGWVMFESTPGYGDYAYSGWLVQEEDESTLEESAPIRGGATEFFLEEEAEELLEVVNEEEEARKAENMRRLMVMAYGVLILLGICLIVFLINLLISKIKYLKKNDTEKFLTDVRKNLWLLEKLGFKRLPSETLDELEDRIGREAPRLTRGTKRLVFIKVYQEYIYRSKAIEKEMLKTALAEREHILSCLKKEKRLHYLRITVGLMLWVDR